MNIVTDIYEYIACLADDATTLNMLSVNKKFLHEDYYRRIIEKKYPYLLKLKAFDKPYTYSRSSHGKTETFTYNYVLTWRKFYIKNVYFMLKFVEIFQIPYFYIKNYYPEVLLQRLTMFERNPHHYLLSRALEQARIDIRNLIFEQKFDVPMNSNLSCAGRSGNLSLVKETYDILSTRLKKIDVKPAISVSIKTGNCEMLNFLLEKGGTRELNYALERSRFCEDYSMMKFLIGKGANNFEECVILLRGDIQRMKLVKNRLHPSKIEAFKKYLSSLK